ncbi:hypothetical protein V1511DRAFT_455951 [Dipodascopsis uninucleata]
MPVEASEKVRGSRHRHHGDHPSAPVTRRRRRTRRKSSGGFVGFLKTIFFHLFFYYIIYFTCFKCPEDPDTSFICPTVNKATLPVNALYHKYLSPYTVPAVNGAKHMYVKYGSPHVQRAAAAAKTQLDTRAGPYISVVSDKYNDLAKAHVDRVVDFATALYNERIIPAYEASLPHVLYFAENVRDRATDGWRVMVEKAGPMMKSRTEKIVIKLEFLWVEIVKLYREIVIRVQKIYEEQVLSVVAMIQAKVLHDYTDDEDEGNEENDDYDDDEDDGEGETEDPITITSTYFTTLPPKTSSEVVRTTEISERSSETSVAIVQSSPKVTPSARPEDAEVALAREEIEQDIINWDNRFRQAGKSAVTNLYKDMEAYFASTRSQLVTEMQANLSKAQVEIDNVLSMSPPEKLEKVSELSLSEKTSDLRDKARSALTSFVKEAENIRQSALDVFKTVTDIGLHELGRKWAFMDGVTWRDWKELQGLRQMAEEFSQVIKDIPIDQRAAGEILELMEMTIDGWASDVRTKINEVVKSANDAMLEQEKKLEEEEAAAVDAAAKTSKSSTSSSSSNPAAASVSVDVKGDEEDENIIIEETVTENIKLTTTATETKTATVVSSSAVKVHDEL